MIGASAITARIVAFCWKRSDSKAIGAIQPSILQHANGKLQALGRSRQGRVWESWSPDNGKTWSPMKLTALPNPNAGTDAETAKQGYIDKVNALLDADKK